MECYSGVHILYTKFANMRSLTTLRLIVAGYFDLKRLLTLGLHAGGTYGPNR